MSSAEVAEVTRQQLLQHANTRDAELRAARCLVDKALNDFQGSDNVSVIVTTLEPPAGGEQMLPQLLPPQMRATPVPLEHIDSQQSLATQTLSPRHVPLEEKLRMPFCEAFGSTRAITPEPPRLRARHSEASGSSWPSSGSGSAGSECAAVEYHRPVAEAGWLLPHDAGYPDDPTMARLPGASQFHEPVPRDWNQFHETASPRDWFQTQTATEYC